MLSCWYLIGQGSLATTRWKVDSRVRWFSYEFREWTFVFEKYRVEGVIGKQKNFDILSWAVWWFVFIFHASSKSTPYSVWESTFRDENCSQYLPFSFSNIPHRKKRKKQKKFTSPRTWLLWSSRNWKNFKDGKERTQGLTGSPKMKKCSNAIMDNTSLFKTPILKIVPSIMKCKYSREKISCHDE